MIRYLALALALAAGALWVPGDPPWLPEVVTRLGRTGWAAALLLVLTLAVTPARAILSLRSAGRLRRRLGLIAFAMTALHGGYALAVGWVAAPREILTEPHLRSGATAAVILALLALTSSARVVRALRLGHWKPLHRAIYPAALLVVHHVALSSHADPWHVAALLVVSCALLLTRVIRGLTNGSRVRPGRR